jgi:hypothetical protein
MSPDLRPRSVARRRPASRTFPGRLAALLVVLGFAVAGCASSFDPTGPCSTDGSVPGAYPELEAAVPTTFRSAAPAELDSGRACTTDGLGTLAGHGVKEIRFAGGTWTTGTDSGLSLAIFTTPDGSALEPAWLAEFYETGARAGKNVTSVEASDYPVTDAVQGRRIDVLNGESYQSIVVWGRNGQVAVALVADFIREIQTKDAHDVVVRAAVDAFGG